MPTPTFKLLANALRLGQPQDPQMALRALVEAFTVQEETIEDLKRRLQVVQSAAQILEAKTSRLEQELEATRHGVSMYGPGTGYQPPTGGSGPNSERPPPMPQSARHPSQAPPGFGSGEMPVPQQAMQAQPIQQQMQAPAAPAHGPRPRPNSEPPMSAAPPMSQQQPQHGQAPQHAMQASMPRPAPLPNVPMAAEESSDDFKVETVVVSRKDVELLMNPEAPFRLPPPGQRVGPERGSIPGAPWARGVRTNPVRPPISEDFTVDADALHDPRDEGDSPLEDGETYRDVGGGVSSLAAALGLSPDDPRLEKLRKMRTSDSTDPRSPAARPSPRPRRR